MPNEDSDQQPRRLIRVSAVRLKTLWIFGYTQSALRRFWSDCADAQADLNLRWAFLQFWRKCCAPVRRSTDWEGPDQNAHTRNIDFSLQLWITWAVAWTPYMIPAKRKYAFWSCSDTKGPGQAALMRTDQGLHYPLTELFDTTECMNWEQRPGWYFCACAEWSDSAHFVHIRRHFWLDAANTCNTYYLVVVIQNIVSWIYIPIGILLKSILDRYLPDSNAVGPITVRYRFKQNASWVWHKCRVSAVRSKRSYDNSMLFNDPARLNRNVRVRNYWHVFPTNTQIRLISVVVVRMRKLCILCYPKCAQWRFWSQCANKQADLKLCWVHMFGWMYSDITAHSKFDWQLRPSNVTRVPACKSNYFSFN